MRCKVMVCSKNKKNSIDDKDRIIFGRLDDMISNVGTGYGKRFMGFLDERETFISKKYLKLSKISNYTFYGGHENSLRNTLCLFSDSANPEEKDFSISGVSFSYRKDRVLSHRDFLGTLLSLQIKKESLGDILVSEGNTVVFAYNHILSVIFNEVKKVGNEGVSLSLELPKILPAAFVLEETNHIISSNRLDCYVATIINKSRKIALEIIKKEMVSINHQICSIATKQVLEGDIISIRGYGRYSLKSFLNKTKKGRQKVVINKYI